MSDHVIYQADQLATPPKATVVATDEIGGAHYQVVKILLGADGGGNLWPTDPISNLPVVIEFDHHQVHEGESHGYSYLIASLASGSSQDFRFNVPATLVGIGQLPHVVIEVISTGETEVYLYEGMTYGAGNGGTLQTTYNRNRSSATAAACTVYLTPTPATTGDNLWIGLTGSGNRTGGGNRSLTEWVLKSNTDYLIRMTSRAAGDKILCRLEWYEDLGV